MNAAPQVPVGGSIGNIADEEGLAIRTLERDSHHQPWPRLVAKLEDPELDPEARLVALFSPEMP